MQPVSNVAKQRLTRGELAIGMGVRGVRGVEIARVMKTAGFDFLFIDLEHGSTSVETAFQISVAALDAGIAPLIRVPHGELALGTRCLDGGGLGVVIPHVDTPEQAREIGKGAYNKVRSAHTYGHRAELLQQVISESLDKVPEPVKNIEL